MPNPVKVKALVTKIIDHNQGVYTIQLDVPMKMARFKAGQFLHLTLGDYDPMDGYWPESRVFSIASKPMDPKLEIVYSVKGDYTKRMSRELYVGKEVWIKLPFGDFTVDNYIKTKSEIILIAGGTGISPFVPFLFEYIENPSKVDLSLYYGIKDENHFLFNELVNSVKRTASVQVVSGMLDVDRICKEIILKNNPTCFISGPPKMIFIFKEKLNFLGVPFESIIIDAWE